MPKEFLEILVGSVDSLKCLLRTGNKQAVLVAPPQRAKNAGTDI